MSGADWIDARSRRRLQDRDRLNSGIARRDALGPMPTLAELRASSPWVWVRCKQSDCTHQAPMAFVPLIIRWGGDTEELRAGSCPAPLRRLKDNAWLFVPKSSFDLPLEQERRICSFRDGPLVPDFAGRFTVVVRVAPWPQIGSTPRLRQGMRARKFDRHELLPNFARNDASARTVATASPNNWFRPRAGRK